MREERGLIEPLSVCLPHSFKHHIRYLNRSFWQGRQGQTFSFSWPIDVLYFPPSGSLIYIYFLPFPFSLLRNTYSRQLRAGNARWFNSSKQPFSLTPNAMLRSVVSAKLARVFWEYRHTGLAAEDVSSVTLELMIGLLSQWWDSGRYRQRGKEQERD